MGLLDLLFGSSTPNDIISLERRVLCLEKQRECLKRDMLRTPNKDLKAERRARIARVNCEILELKQRIREAKRKSK